MASRGRRLVVKIGTNTLRGTGLEPDPTFLSSVAEQVAELQRNRWHVLLVSSGAIGAGRAAFGIHERPQSVILRQACAAVGQSRLMRAWELAFSPHGIMVAQLLLTQHSFADRPSFLHLRNVTEALLERAVVPIINENDTVSIHEIGESFGDNDWLSALVASKIRADLLLILSDVDGLFTAPPHTRGSRLVREVTAVTPAVLAMAGLRSGSSTGRGGMRSKLQAAALCARCGIPVIIAHGRMERILLRAAMDEPIGTRILPSGRERSKSQWLRGARAAGRIHVDPGAATALRRGANLLPAGIVAVDGTFDEGSVVEIVHDHVAVAKAVSTLSSDDLLGSMGLRSSQLKSRSGRSGSWNVTRRGNIVLLV